MMNRQPRKYNIVGTKIGRLFIASEIERYVTPAGRTIRQFQCVCECGNKVKKRIEGLVNGHTRSCGCLRKETTIKRKTTHGKSQSPLYNIHQKIIRRCYKKNCKAYKDYGGRGIKVCKRWMDFQTFYGDMSGTYFSGATIERKDVNGNYNPSNCEWIKRGDQNKNTRKTVYLFYNGKRQKLIDLAEQNGIKKNTLRARIFDYKWSVKRAVETPVN